MISMPVDFIRAMVWAALLTATLAATACGGGTRPVTPGPEPEVVVTPAEPELLLPGHLETWRPLLERLQSDGFDPYIVADLLNQPGAGFDPSPMSRKLETLYRLLFESERTKEIQRGLAMLGYDVGPDDGMAGSHTRGAIREFQELHYLDVDGEPTEELLSAIRHDLAKPPEARPVPTGVHGKGEDGPRVHESALRPEVITKAREFMAANRAALNRVESMYGVPPEIVTAILTVETRIGENMGYDNAFVILSSMALSRDLNVIEPYLWQHGFTTEERDFLREKAREKGDWAYQELTSLLTHCRDQGTNPLAFPSSIYGAVGICQFMPSNILLYGVDGDMDGDVDLFSMADAVMSVGSYFAGHGWRTGLDEEGQRDVVHSYNHSTIYVNTIMTLAGRLR